MNKLNASQPIVYPDGTMSPPFRLWALTVGLPMIGAGSPEGVVEAIQGQLYMDSAGTTGSILYIKRDPDIGGDRTQGWIPV